MMGHLSHPAPVVSFNHHTLTTVTPHTLTTVTYHTLTPSQFSPLTPFTILSNPHHLTPNALKMLTLTILTFKPHPPPPPTPSHPHTLTENVSQLLRHMFEEHQPASPGEDLVKCGASGDLVRVEELVKGGDVAVDYQCNGNTALQTASQVSPSNKFICSLNQFEKLVLSGFVEVTIRKCWKFILYLWNSFDWFCELCFCDELQNGHIDVVKCLLRHDANIEAEVGVA